MTFSSAGELWTANLPGLLTPEERDTCAVYAAVQPVASGEALQFARTTITAPWDAFLAFVDRDPMANWGHSCRYILFNRATGEVASTEARYPPFAEKGFAWHVVYKSASVPEAVLADPRP
jgi:hypothetical protein